MKIIKFFSQAISLAFITGLFITLLLNQQALSAVNEPESPTINESIASSDNSDNVDAGALRWCYLWCTTIDAGPSKVFVTLDLTRTQDLSGRPMKGTIHFLLVSSSTNITFPVLRTSPLLGRLVTPTITINNGTKATYEFTDLEAGGYQIVTLLSETGLPGTPQWSGYAYWGQNFNVSKSIPPSSSAICTTRVCLNTQTFLRGRMRVSGVVTGTQNGEPIQGDIHIMMMPDYVPLLINGFEGSSFNHLPLPGFIFTPTINNITNGRSYTLELSNLRAGHWRSILIITQNGKIGQDDWGGSFTWTENTVYSVQYLASVFNDLIVPEPTPETP